MACRKTSYVLIRHLEIEKRRRQLDVYVCLLENYTDSGINSDINFTYLCMYADESSGSALPGSATYRKHPKVPNSNSTDVGKPNPHCKFQYLVAAHRFLMIIISYFKDLQRAIYQTEALTKVRQMNLTMVPFAENEVVVSTTPKPEHYTNIDNHCNSIENSMALIAENEVVITTTPEDTNSLNNLDVTCMTWVAKARLRPRPIKYIEKEKKDGIEAPK